VNFTEPVVASFLIQGASGFSAIGIYPLVVVKASKITVLSTQGIIFGGLMKGNEKLGLNNMCDSPLWRGVLMYAKALHSL